MYININIKYTGNKILKNNREYQFTKQCHHHLHRLYYYKKLSTNKPHKKIIIMQVKY